MAEVQMSNNKHLRKGSDSGNEEVKTKSKSISMVEVIVTVTI